MKNSSFLGLLQSTDIPMNNPLSQSELWRTGSVALGEIRQKADK